MRITVYVDEQAAIRDGGKRSGYFQIDLDFSALTPEQRDAIAQDRNYSSGNGYYWNPPSGNPTQENLSAWADHLIARNAEKIAQQAKAEADKKAEIEKRILKWLAMSEAELADEHIGNYTDGDLAARSDPRLTDRLARRLQILDQRAAEKRARQAAEEEARKQDEAKAAAERQAKAAEEEAQAEAKRLQRAEWVAQNGTQSQRERLAAGLLATGEIETGMVDLTFAPLAEYALYAPIKTGDLEHEKEDSDYGEEHDAIHCSTSPSESATADQWALLQAIRAAMPEAEAVLRQHYCYCKSEDCDATLTRYGVRVTKTVGRYKFSREYAAPDA